MAAALARTDIDLSQVVGGQDGSLLGWWLLDEETATDTCVDLSGNGNDGTPNGSGGTNNLPQPTVDVPIVTPVERSRDFDGTDDSINLGDVPMDATPTGLTVSCWIKPQTISGRHDIVNKYSVSGGRREFTLYQSGSRLEWTVQEVPTVFNGASVLITSNFLVVGTWYQIVATFAANSEMKLYSNGSEIASLTVASVPSNFVNTTQELFIGTGPSVPFFDGLIGNVRLYNRALSSTEVSSIYTGDIALGSASANGAAAYYYRYLMGS